jgi:hypothetical protein
MEKGNRIFMIQISLAITPVAEGNGTILGNWGSK